MKKVWTYISIFLTGVIGGLIAMYKLMGDQVTVNVGRIKNKNVGESDISIPINVESPKNQRIQPKYSRLQQLRNRRKAKKEAKRIRKGKIL